METQTFPLLRQVVLDTTHARALAEFYRKLLGYSYRQGDEPPGGDQPDEKEYDWLVLHDQAGSTYIAFQQVPALRRSTWPEGEIPQQLHLDMSVPTAAELEIQHRRALELGATVLYDRSHDDEEPLWVYADPDGHPFCIFVAP
jgi:catechol 2,3-dioxygenase-like lactoylglutathione lyase family enzyme